MWPHVTLLVVLPLSLLLGFSPFTRACSTPPGGCLKEQCHRLRGITPPYQSRGGPYIKDDRIGWIYGVYNKNLPAGSTSQRGVGGIVNWEIFPGIDYDYVVLDANKKVVDTRGITTLEDCCYMCARTDGCRVYQFFDNMDWTKIKIMWDSGGNQFPRCAPINFWGDRQCYLFTGGIDKQETSFGAPYSGTNTQQQQDKACSDWSAYPNKWYPPSWVGGACNGNTSVVDDPHFTGAKGTRFEFNGEIDRTFALITDRSFHMNVKLEGYLDDRTFGATKTQDGKAVRTWIREIGLIWRDGAGAQHTAVLVARKGPKMAREAEGYLASLVLDGRRMAVPREPQQSAKEDMFSLTLLKVDKRSIFDVETYELSIRGVASLIVKLRAAHPMLQTDADAYVHFNVHIADLTASPQVHGVLGQTFRQTVTQTVKALEFRLLTRLMGAPVVADGDSGKGFLDGRPEDYKTSGLLATDSTYSSFVA